jgi:LuxR family transcriptional regulator, maltose regulon positive regulatory protein
MCPDGTIAASNHSRIVIYTLGRFEVVLNGAPLRFKGRAPMRPLDLLTALIAAGEGGASAGRLADQLWPDSDGFDAYRALTTALHRLRALLQSPDAVRLSAGRLMLDTDICTVDAWSFERALRGAADTEAVGAVLDTYQGPFLLDESKPWAIEMRDRLERLIARKSGQIWNGFRPWKGGGLISAYAS